jgi:hypothetical protein
VPLPLADPEPLPLAAPLADPEGVVVLKELRRPSVEVAPLLVDDPVLEPVAELRVPVLLPSCTTPLPLAEPLPLAVPLAEQPTSVLNTAAATAVSRYLLCTICTPFSKKRQHL